MCIRDSLLPETRPTYSRVYGGGCPGQGQLSEAAREAARDTTKLDMGVMHTPAFELSRSYLKPLLFE
eukprot:6661724-Heterocapsa_arctica.AAC.1